MGLENFGLEPKDDKNNFQPRIGFAYDVRGNGKDVIRGGWGIYYGLRLHQLERRCSPPVDATGNGFGAVLQRRQPAGIRNPDGSSTGRPAAREHRRARTRRTERAAAVRPVRSIRG